MGRVAALVLCAVVVVNAQTAPPTTSWLDGQRGPWNQPGGALPAAAFRNESRRAILDRCQLTERRSTVAERALADAGWIPFLNFGRSLVAGDVEVVGGMAAADGMCRPWDYNVFVFVGGRFAGTLSPHLMVSRTDGQLGEVLIQDRNTLSGSFSRFTETDPMCCPSAQVKVSYRIDRSGVGPTVIADLREPAAPR